MHAYILKQTNHHNINEDLGGESGPTELVDSCQLYSNTMTMHILRFSGFTKNGMVGGWTWSGGLF